MPAGCVNTALAGSVVGRRGIVNPLWLLGFVILIWLYAGQLLGDPISDFGCGLPYRFNFFPEIRRPDRCVKRLQPCYQSANLPLKGEAKC
jgi:hypothetical protein